MKFNIGDVVLAPLPETITKDMLITLVGVVVNFESDNKVIFIDGNGVISKHPSENLSLFRSYKDLLKAITQKGCELVERTKSG